MWGAARAILALAASPTQLLTEYLPPPVLGIDRPNPRFSWASAASASRDTSAEFYQVQVIDEHGRTVWDSGRQPRGIGGGEQYAGPALAPDAPFQWRVREWLSSTGATDFSAFAAFSTGLTTPGGWDAALSIHYAGGGPPPPPPPFRPACTGDCRMLEMPEHHYYGGTYCEDCAHAVATVEACEAACIADATCVQVTWAPTHSDRCVKYTSLARSRVQEGARGFVKCNATETLAQCTGAGGTVPLPADGPPAQLLRRAFRLAAAPKRATLYLSAVGWAMAHINGRAVAARDVLNPGRTNFDARQDYTAHDVTAMLAAGANAIGIELAAGWQSVPGHTRSARALLSIVHADGTRSTVGTGPDWNASVAGPIRAADIYHGMTFDARKEIDGWAAADFQPAAPQWSAAATVDEFATVVPSWQPMQPIRALELNRAVSVTPVGPSAFVFAFRQNAAGTSVLTVRGCPTGTVLQLFPSEVLCGQGTTRWSPPCAAGQIPGNGIPGSVDQRNLRGNWQNAYICRGAAAEESWEPRFTYTGHKYVELHGHTWATPDQGVIQQRVIHSDVEGRPVPTAQQELPRRTAGAAAFGLPDAPAAQPPAIDGPACYNGQQCTALPPTTVAGTAVLDQLSHLVRFDLIDNLHSVPEDCDQRNERWGWMADASVSAEANFHLFWIPGLYSSWLENMHAVQTEPSAECAAVTGPLGDTNVVDGRANCSGAVGDLTPGRTPAQLPGDPSWMFAYPLVFSYQTRYFADLALAHRLWPGIKSFVGFLQRMASRGKRGLLSWSKYGDWLEPGKVPSNAIIREMGSAFSYGQALRIARDTAKGLGDPSKAAYAAALAAVQQAFHAQYATKAADGSDT